MDDRDLANMVDYDRRSTFNPRHPDEGELLECFVKRHFPEGVVYIQSILVERRGIWYEYDVYPVDSVSAALSLFGHNTHREGKGLWQYVFVDGKRLHCAETGAL